MAHVDPDDLTGVDGAAAAERRPRWREQVWVGPLALFGLSRLVLWATAVYAAHGTPVGPANFQLGFWDSGYYLKIIEFGYPAHANLSTYSAISFFPGFPVAARAIKVMLSLTPLEAGMVVANVCAGLFVITAARLVAKVYDADAGRRAGMLVAVFPGAWVTFVPYAEPMAMLFVALALIACVERRPYRAGVWGALATFTSPLTSYLVPALLVGAWRRRSRSEALGALLATVGFAAYMVYLWAHTGSPFAWFHNERSGFGLSWSATAPWRPFRYWPGIGLTVCFSLAALALMAYAMWKVRVPVEWAVYSLLIMVSILFNSALWLNPRFLLDAFPLVLALGVWLKRDAFRAALATSAAILPLVMLFYLTMGNVTAQP